MTSMDLWCVHAKSIAFLTRNSLVERKKCSMNWEFRSSKAEFATSYRYRSVSVKAMAERSSGNPSNSNWDSSSFSSDSGGNSDRLKAGEDGLKGNNTPPGSNKADDISSQNTRHKPLDWRELRALLYINEPVKNVDFVHNREETSHVSKSLPSTWAHPISAPENGCLLVATEKLDGIRSFERTVILLLRSGTRNPREEPFGVVINRPANKKMKHMNPTNTELGTTFADCSLHFGGPVNAIMFMLRAGDTTRLPGFEEVIPGVYFGSGNCFIEASALIKEGKILPQDFGFFMGYAGWQLEQLRDEIESGYWCVAACSSNLISWMSQDSSSSNLWEEILQLMGGPYSELSRKPKQDI